MTLVQDNSIRVMTPEPALAPADADVAIRFRDVRKTYRLYGSFQDMAFDRMGLPKMLMHRRGARIRDFHALDGVNLEIRRGERLGIIGRNGAGKTTLLKLIIGNFEPSAGRVEVNGTVQALLQIGFGFNPEMSGLENIRSALLYNGFQGRELDEATAEVVDFVELDGFIDQPVRTYSQGMLARLQFAAATALRPDIVLVDEVMGAGDAYFTAKCSQRMRQLTQSGCTLLLVSHSPQQVIQYCDRAIWLREGRVFRQGDATEVAAAYEVYIQRMLTRGMSDSLELPHAARVAGVSEPSDVVSELLTTLSDGRNVHRWPGREGLLIDRFAITCQDNATGSINTGDPLEIEFHIRITKSGDYSAYYYLTFWTADGCRAVRVESPVDRFVGREGDTRRVIVQFKSFPLGAGEIQISFSIYDESEVTSTIKGPDTRYDTLMRADRLRVSDPHTDCPATSYPPAVWKFHKASGD